MKARFWIIILAVIILILSLLVVIFFVYNQGYSLESNSLIKRTTDKRIEQLEEKIKNLEENQKVPFPEGRNNFSLTKDQISAIVSLWCPDDNYGYNSFISLGSGAIIDSKGIIVTNRHVISNYDWSVIKSSPTCYVAVTDNISKPPVFKYTADIIAYAPYVGDDYDFDFDVAILKISDICEKCEDAPEVLPASFSFLDVNSSDALTPGDYIAIAGYPSIGADTFTFTEGIVSGRVGDFVIKTDAKIDSGNSGGAALNNNNNLVGVPTWTITGEAESLGYTIGIDQIMNWYKNKVISSNLIEIPYE
jgi:S1-C subfamily serine protease